MILQILIVFLSYCQSQTLDEVCPSSPGRIRTVANISSSRSCEVLRSLTYQRILFDNDAGMTWICYDKNNKQSDLGSALCTFPAMLLSNITRGIPALDYFDPHTIYNTTGNETVPYLQWLGTQNSCYFSDPAACASYLALLGISCASPSAALWTCKKQKLVTELRVDCGFGYFKPLATFTDIICLPEFNVPTSAGGYSLFRFPDFAESTNDGLSVSLSFRASNNDRWITLDLILYEKELKDFVMTQSYHYVNKSVNRVSIIVPYDVRLNSIYGTFQEGRFLLWVEKNQSSYQNLDFENVTKSDLCNRGLCEHCERSLLTLYCKVGNFGWWNTAFVIFFIILFLAFIPWLLAFFTFLYRCLGCLMCTPKRLTKNLSDKLFRKKASALPVDEDEYELLDAEERKKEEIQRKVEKAKKKKAKEETVTDKDMEKMNYEERMEFLRGKPRTSFPTLTLTIMCLISLGAAQCTDSILSTGHYRSCILFNSTHKVCSFDLSAEIELSGVGEVSCLTFMSNTTQKPWKLNITFESLEVEAKLVWLYPTVDWVPEFRASKSCFLESCCTYHTTKSCSQWAESSPQNPCSKFSDTVLNTPGFTGCLSKPGCAANGCFSCHESCNYYRANFRPANSAWNVSTTGLITQIATFSMQSEGTPKVFFSTSIPNFDIGIFRMELIGVLGDSQLTFSKKIISSGELAFYADASEPNDPVKGLPGDIQASSPDYFKDHPELVIFDRSIVETFVDSGGAYATYARSGISDLDRTHQFPTMIDASMWQFDPASFSIKSKLARRSVALLKFSTTSAIEVLETIDSVCPEIRGTPTLTGCFSCSGGGQIKLEVKSGCFPGSCVAVSYDPLVLVIQNSLPLVDDFQTVSISLLTNENHPDFLLGILCNGGSANVSVSGDLSSDVNIYNGYNQTSTERHETGSSFDNKLFDWLKDLLGIGKEWVLLIFYILVALAFILFLALVLYCVFKALNCGGTKVSFAKSKTHFLSTAMGFKAAGKQMRRMKKEKQYKLVPKEEAVREP